MNSEIIRQHKSTITGGVIIFILIFIAVFCISEQDTALHTPEKVKTTSVAPVKQNSVGQTQSKNLHKYASSANNGVVLTKDAVDDLVRKAADQKYLQDVLSSGPKLPVASHKTSPITLQPNDVTPPTTVVSANPAPAAQQVITSLKTANDNQHCSFNGQTYSLGEIVQIDKGWVRCTPSIMVSADGSSQYGSAVWILRDSLL
jgi:hypothetical protein